MVQAEIVDLASKVEAALNAADLSAFAALLDPDVNWGPPGDAVSGCHNRAQVVTWYERARAGGMSGQVTEVVAGEGVLLVGLRVEGTEEARQAGGVAERWQVLRVRQGRVVDIRGYPDRGAAAAAAGIAS